MCATLPEGGLVAHKKRESEAPVTSLSLILDHQGIVLIRNRAPIGSLKAVLESDPRVLHVQEIVDSCRWVDDLLQDAFLRIAERYEFDESIRIQEQYVRSESEVGYDKDVTESEGSRRLY
jgi:hypothetical protein